MSKKRPISISNASSHYIFGSVKADICHNASKDIQVKAGAGVTGAEAKVGYSANNEFSEGIHGFSLIARYTSLEFHVELSKQNAYATIVFADERSGEIGKVLCENHPIPSSNCGLIITNHGHLQFAKAKSKWIDTAGINHEPTEEMKQYKNVDLSAMKYLNPHAKK